MVTDVLSLFCCENKMECYFTQFIEGFQVVLGPGYNIVRRGQCLIYIGKWQPVPGERARCINTAMCWWA